jgi:predicted membrane channel-forming protein YqfA (hemolysin III family)
VLNPKEAYRRVLLPGGNPTPGHDRTHSVVGATGHLERANAWTHLVAFVLSAGYALERVRLVDSRSLASQLSGVAIVMQAILFAVSVVYHVYATVPGWGHVMRNLDHLAIYMAMGVSGAADAALVTVDFRDAPAHALADPVLAATCLGAYFAARRCLVPCDETRDFQFNDVCSLGLFRVFHSDLEHSGLRTAGVGVLSLTWILMTPAAFANLEPPVAVVYLVGRVLGLMVLVIGVLFDNHYAIDRALADGDVDGVASACGCASKRLGCVMTSHAWWHVASFLATVVLTASREYGVSQIAH